LKDVLTSILQGVSPKLVTELWLDFEDTQQYLDEAFDTISGLEDFQQLEKLSLAGHDIQRLGDLPSLFSLIYLDVSHNRIEDISAIDSLSSLRYLDLSYNELSELAPLEPLAKLEHLNLGHNFLEDITPLSSLEKLEWLNISGHQHKGLRRLDALGQHRGLLHLFAAHLRLESLQFIPPDARLQSLSITPIYTCDLTPLGRAAKLKDLTIGGKFLDRGLHLPPLPQLESLRIHQGQISQGEEIRGIEFGKQLKHLHLIGLSLDSLPDLSQCQELETLILKSNQLKAIGPVMDLPRLRHLDIRENPIDGGSLRTLLNEKPGLEVLY